MGRVGTAGGKMLRFDERSDRAHKEAMNEDVLDVLRAYPQIYLACHVGHRTRASSPTGLTSNDASLLAHIEDPAGSGPAALARHLGVAPSTLSASLARLEGFGLIAFEKDRLDRRRRSVRLTAKGHEAIVAESVLDAVRVAAMLAGMNSTERRSAVAGLRTLAAAALRLREREG